MGQTTTMLYIIGILGIVQQIVCHRVHRLLPKGMNSLDSDMCTKTIEHIYHGHIAAPIPPHIIGVWTSERCETRPGPEYILRKYHFPNTTHFEAHQYYYEDPDCTNPIYGITARGLYSMVQGSWIVPGGTETDYFLTKVSLIPYTNEMARELGARVNESCKDYAPASWQPYESYEILQYKEIGSENGGDPDDFQVIDRDCTNKFQFTMHELQLMRVENQRHHHTVMRELYLGDIHTDRLQRAIYRPTSYQSALVDGGTLKCKVCNSIENSDDFYPPHLTRQYRYKSIDLTGEWFSLNCETRPNGMFLVRRLMFSNHTSTWQGYYYYYIDPLCREPYFTILAKGTYTRGSVSKVVHEATNFNFKVLTVHITPEDIKASNTLNNNNGEECGTRRWETGIQQDVTPTKGCRVFGISIPFTEYEIAKVEKRKDSKTLLYLGQRPSNGASPTTPELRPTSFQAPVVKCGHSHHRHNKNTKIKLYNVPAQTFFYDSNNCIKALISTRLLIALTISVFLLGHH
ncbi:unnamed protein product [Owenia fusiformis]|uniref:Uncharacterized protein n=1 Tax=Owenia fusiformis TaxID=6347 RepID=A0A8J1TYC8_OWEFU|nr:unnamed protein product [Owenia fusiformis]